MMRPSAAVLLAMLVVASGCAPAPGGPATVIAGASHGKNGQSGLDGPESERLVAEASKRAFGALASVDGRLAARMRVVPTEEELGKAAMGAVVHGDEGVAVVKGATDLFSFDVRARRLDEEGRALAERPALAEVAGPGAPGVITRPALEWQLLTRLVAEERARLAEEQDLPRSASELVRGLVSTWTPPASMAEARERDTWLARRLDEVQAAVVRAAAAGTGLRPVDVTELESALDPLERLADPLGFPRVQASMTRLRVALGQLRPPPGHREGWDALERSMRAHFGVAPEPKALRAMLDELAASLRAEATVALGKASFEEARAAREGTRLLAAGACGEVRGSPIRSFAPPPERAPICAALEALRHAKGETGLEGLVALADTVTLAIWAVAIDGDGEEPYRTVSAHPLLSAVPPEAEGPLMRSVATRPLLPIGVALMARLVATPSQTPDERESRVARWLAFGDAPIDVVARELGLELP